MNNNPLTKGMIEANSVGVGEISEEMVEERAKELALIAGHRVTKEYHEQALRELSGGSEIDEKTSLLGFVCQTYYRHHDKEKLPAGSSPHGELAMNGRD